MIQAGKKQIAWWLLAGVVMIYFQIVIGGITRLTGSGLSITKWEIVTGALPPLNETKWVSEFNLYKNTPQYHRLNHGMSLSEFKFIYFWEYFHRLWARLMGFVFAIPFFIFLYQKKLPADFIKKLVVLILLAGLVASFGWIMVQSGLVNRPWVNAYKLTLHLTLALITYGYLLRLFFAVLIAEQTLTRHTLLKNFSRLLLCMLAVQLVLGGLMSGMRAGLYYPTFPLMQGQLIPDVLRHASNWTLHSFIHYDTNLFAPAVVQMLHRTTAFLLTLLIFVFYFLVKRNSSENSLRTTSFLLAFLVVVQVLLGIATVLNFSGETPVLLGVLHQAVAILLLTALLGAHFLLRKKSSQG